MQNIKNLKRKNLEKIKAVCFDCDGVIVPEATKVIEKGNVVKISAALMSDKTAFLLTQLKKHFILIFNSGKSLLHLTGLFEKILWERVALIGEMGIFNMYQGKVVQPIKFSSHYLKKGLKIKQAIRQLMITDKNITGFEPKQFLITVHCLREDKKIIKTVQSLDKENEYQIVWSGEAYDILPKNFNKAKGLESLLKSLGLNFRNVITVGNDPNDKEMVEKAGLSISTNPKTLPFAKYKTQKLQEKGGEEAIKKLLELVNN